MTPKEKAKELIEKFYWDYDRAKQCALIAVDELIKATTPLTSTHYWKEVKEEINKL